MKVFAQIVNGFYFLTIFLKSSILDVWQDSQFASKGCYDIVEKAPPQMFGRVLNLPLITSKYIQPLVILAKLLAIYFLNLINIKILCMVFSRWPYFQHNC